jgi:predicted alpha/beta hydrolase
MLIKGRLIKSKLKIQILLISILFFINQSMAELVNISLADQSGTKIEIFGKADQTKPLLILMPAMGVAAKYYRHFAEYIADKLDVLCINTDLRGLGNSTVRASTKSDFGYQEIINDYIFIIRFCQEKFPDFPIFLVGHSLGGHIANLLSTHKELNIKGLILIACGSNYYKNWSGFSQISFGGFMRLSRILSRLLGYFPGKKLGFGGTEAKTLIQDWSYMGLYGKYKIQKSDKDYENALKKVNIPILAIGIAGDNFAPSKAIDFWQSKFAQNIDFQRFTVSSETPKINHLSWAKQPQLFEEILKNYFIK